MLYRLLLDEDNYLTGFVYTDKPDGYEIDPSIMDTEYLNCYRLVDDYLFFDVEKKAEIIRAKEEEAQHKADIDEQTLKLAQMFVTMGVDVDDFLDRLDAQSLYTAMVTGTILNGEE